MGKFVPNWNAEPTQEGCVTLTPTAWHLLVAEAQRQGVSPAEVIEQFALGLQRDTPAHQTSDSLALPDGSASALNHEVDCNSLSCQQVTDYKVATVLESISDAFVAFDREWYYTYVNYAAAQFLQKSPEDLLGKNIWTEVYPHLIGTISYQSLQRAIAEHRTVCWEDWSDELQRWVEARAYPSSEGVAVYFRDITERKYTEARLQESEARYRRLFEDNPQPMWMFAAETLDFLDVNAAAIQHYGYSRDEFLAMSLGDICPSDHISTLLHNIATTHRGLDYSGTWQHRRKDGSIIDVEMTCHEECFLEQRAWLVLIKDITEQKQAEEALRESEARFRLMAETIPDMFWITDFRTAQILYVSPAYRTIWGRSPEELYDNPTTWANTIHPNDRERILEMTTTHQNQGIVEQEYQIVRPDGSIRWIRDRRFAVHHNGCTELMVGIAQDITDRRNAIDALKQSEAKFRRLIEASIFGVAIGDMVGKISYANHAFLHMIGYSSTELDAGQISWLSLTPPEYLPLDFQAGEELRQRGVFTPFEKEYIHKDGHRVPVLLGGTFFNEPNGQVIGFYLDLTELKQTENALREQQTLLETILEQAADAILVSDATGKLTFINAEAQRLARHHTTASNAELSLSSWGIAYRPEGDRVPIADYPISKALRGESSTASEFRMVRPDGSYYDLLVSAVPLQNYQQQIIGAVATFIDISDRKRDEEALRQSEERLRVAVKNSPITVFNQDRELRYTWVYNPALNRQASEIIGKHDREMLAPDEAERLVMLKQHVLNVGVGTREEVKLTFGGQEFCYDLTIEPLLDDHGDVIGITCAAIDITERKQAEEALRTSAERLSVAMSAAKLGDWSWDIATDRILFSERAAELFGVPSGSYLTWSEIQNRLHADDREQTRLRIQQAIADHSDYDIEYRIRRLDSTECWIAAKGRAQYDSSGRVLGMLGVVQDITYRKYAEAERERLLAQEQAAREAAETANRIKDEFLAVLSHELRSPLNPILGWSKLLQTRQLDERSIQRALETIERNAKLQAELIEDLLDVSRILQGKMVLNASLVNLVTVVELALETVRLAAEAKHIPIQTQILVEAACVFGDSARLQQIVWNLLSNAVKFTPQGGQVTVRLEVVDGQTCGTSPAELHASAYAQITVTDTGKGIRPDFLPYVFDYFRQEDGKTTRKFGGLGLGLAIVRHLTELHGGTVHVHSLGEGLGSTFTIRLPLSQQAVNPAQPLSSTTATVDLSQLHILIVDDDADMRELAQFLLHQQGAQVQVAASAAEGLRLFDRHPPDVLISDIGMPGMDGYALMRQIRQRSPHEGGQVPAIALTAYAGEYNERQALQAGFQRHISKPVEPEVLMKAIAQIVDRPLAATASPCGATADWLTPFDG